MAVDTELEEEIEQEIEQTPEPEQEAPEQEEAEPEAASEDDQPEAPKREVYSLAGDKPKEEKQPAPAVMKQMRERIEALNKELRTYRTQNQPVPEELQSKPRPTLKDFDYDEEKHASAVLDWGKREEKIKSRKDEIAKEQEEVQQSSKQAFDAYVDAKGKMDVEDFDDAELLVTQKLSILQQNAIIGTALRPEVMVYVLGTHPEKLDELAKIKDPGKFIAAIARMEVKEVSIKNEPKAKPGPERGVQTSTAAGGTRDAVLEKLEAEADRSGDRTKVIAYRRQQREKAAAKGR